MAQSVSQYSVQEVQQAHQELTRADDLRKSGDMEGALEICEELLESYSDYFSARLLTAVMYMQHGNYAGALPHLVRARLVNANDPTTLANLGKAYLELDALECAVEALEQSIALSPEESMPHYFMGELWLTRNDYERAGGYFQATLVRDPEHSSAMIRLGHCQASLGRYEEGLSTLKSALGLPITDDQKSHIYQILSEFPEPVEDSMDILSEISKLGAADTEGETEQDPGQPVLYFTANIPFGELSQAFARGIMFDKIGRHQEAWNAFTDVNKRIANDTVPQRALYFTQGEALLDRARMWQPRTKKKKTSSRKNGPISLFILGPSRSGKTTLEKLVGLLDGVRLGYEHSIVTDTAQRASQRADLLNEQFLANLPSDANDLISEIYHRELAAVAGDAQLFTITHPGAISDVGRLSDLVPDARFVLLKRDLDDMAFRIFAYLYQADTNQFAYDIRDIYRYLELYNRTVDIWAEKIGERVLVLSYEDMMKDPKAAIRRIAELCGMKPPENMDVQIGSDVGIAAPYRDWLHAARDNAK